MMELELQGLSVLDEVEGTSADGGGTAVAGSILDEAIEARTIVERAIVRLAAYRRTEADLERLEEALGRMQAAGSDRDAFNDGDFAFHVALSRAAHNALLAETLASLHGPVRHMIDLFSDAAFRDGGVADLVRSHARLADAVSRQDGDEAPAIVTEMMTRLREEAAVRATARTPTLSMVGHSARSSKGERS